MLKYTDSKIVFREVPGEISLALDISGCPFKCKNCHSPELQTDVGIELSLSEIYNLVSANPGITCLCFMGGDGDIEGLKELLLAIKQTAALHLNKFKLAWYSGAEYKEDLFPLLDYYKCGPYIEEKGPLNRVNSTNQGFYHIKHTTKGTYKVENWNYKFASPVSNSNFEEVF